MKRSDRTPIERAVDDVVAHAMKWYHWQYLAPGDRAVKDIEANKILQKLANACARLQRRKRKHNETKLKTIARWVVLPDERNALNPKEDVR